MSDDKKSERLQTKDERDEWLEEQKENFEIDLDDTEPHNGYFLADYYEKGKPITLKGWKKLIEDLNDLFENPPGIECDTIETMEVPEDSQVWKLEDVEDIREKLEEMCHNNSFDWGWYLENWGRFADDEDKELLKFPFGREIIYEIVIAMMWCNCGSDILSLEENYPAVGNCINRDGPSSTPTKDLESLIDGLAVGPEGYIGSWQFILVSHSTILDASREHLRTALEQRYAAEAADAIANDDDDFIPRTVGFWDLHRRNIDAWVIRSGKVDCDGLVEYQPNDEASVPTEWLIDYECYEDYEDNCVLATTKPIWWFSNDDWQAYNQEVYDQCLQYIYDARARAIQGAQDAVDRHIADGKWHEYILRFSPGSRSEECVEEEESEGESEGEGAPDTPPEEEEEE